VAELIAITNHSYVSYFVEKRPEEIDQLPDEYFDGSAEKRQIARQHVTAIKKITEEYLNPSLLDVRETHFHSGNTNKKPSSTNAV